MVTTCTCHSNTKSLPKSPKCTHVAPQRSNLYNWVEIWGQIKDSPGSTLDLRKKMFFCVCDVFFNFLSYAFNKNGCVAKPWTSSFQNIFFFWNRLMELGTILILVQEVLKKSAKSWFRKMCYIYCMIPYSKCAKILVMHRISLFLLSFGRFFTNLLH